MRARARHGVAAVLATTILLTLAGPSDAAPDVARRPGPEIVLVAQTPVSPPGSTFVVRLQLPGVPADGSVRIVVHQRVRSRSELALSMEGEGLRSDVFAHRDGHLDAPRAARRHAAPHRSPRLSR